MTEKINLIIMGIGIILVLFAGFVVTQSFGVKLAILILGLMLLVFALETDMGKEVKK